MSVFHVPDDFPLVSLAVASPLVQKGDVILVKKGVESEVVVVPPKKRGLRIVGDGGEGVIPESVEVPADTVDGLEAGGNTGAENEAGDIDPPGPDETPDGDPLPETGPPWLEGSAAAGGEAEQHLSREKGREEPDMESQPFIMVTRAGGKMIRTGSGSWVIVHRSR